MKLLNRVKNLNKEKSDKKGIKHKLLITFIMTIPFISIILVIMFRSILSPTNEDVLEKLKNKDNYESIVEYTIKNDKGEYTEKTKVLFCNDHGIRIDFGEELTKIYKDDIIIMNYNKKNKVYEVKRNLDNFYTLSIMSELLKNPIIGVEEGQDEWGDLKYLKVDIDLISNNDHLDKATLYVNKSKKEPMLIKIYDNKGEERVKMDYREFSELKKCDEEKFSPNQGEQ
ncbi:MAG: germination lipoprotein GerS-related protein [Clostridium sp.]|uniref:germination lipoprotein GerS-related protein n=1 Tax=Clostridium sp. TaxID=1506 RepID=UPI003F33999B